MGAVKRDLEENIDKITDKELIECGFSEEEIYVMRESFGNDWANYLRRIGT